MVQEMGSYTWMLTHAVAIDTNKNIGTYRGANYSIMTDVFLMILCKAFLLPQSDKTRPESVD